MREKLPRISVIIPVQPAGDVSKAVRALKKIDYPQALVEVWVVYGFCPSRQRNLSAKKAKGEILYFIDNDSRLDKLAFKKVAAAFRGKAKMVRSERSRGFSLLPKTLCDLIVKKLFSGQVYQGKVGAVGGPNIWWGRESFWASMAGIVLESFYAHSQMAARYRPIGRVHRASEKELILCNLAIARKVFREVGGFNEALYPNEENELLNRIEKAGFQLIYHPQVLVLRPRRQSLKSIIKAFFHYGRGRMEQVRIEGVWQSLPVLLPLTLLVYLPGLIFYHDWIAFLPLAFYFTMGFGSALGFALRRKKAYLALALPWFFLVVHLTYDLGLLYGLTTNFGKVEKKKQRRLIKILKAKGFNQGWQGVYF